jgi:hypothetical protein
MVRGLIVLSYIEMQVMVEKVRGRILVGQL